MDNYKIYNKIITDNFDNCPQINHVFRFPVCSLNYYGRPEENNKTIMLLEGIHIV